MQVKLGTQRRSGPFAGPIYCNQAATCQERPRSISLTAPSCILFEHSGDNFVMNADGSGQTRVTNTQQPGTFVQSSSPVFSPIAQNKIAFANNGTGDNDIYVVNTDGSGMASIAFSDSEESHPSWSPDGQKIAYDSGDIFVMNADGSNKVCHTFGLSGSDPTFSPDGKKLAFKGRLSGFRDRIFVQNTDPSAFTSPVTDKAENVAPD